MSERLPDDVVDRLSRLIETGVDPRAAAPGPSLRRYELREMIGEGAAGAVYRGRDRELNRPVAVKLLKPAAGEAGVVAEVRFQREAQVAARLSHPNVIPVYDIGQEDGRIYLVMELVEGNSLQEVLRGRPLEPDQVASLMEKVARGVAAAHAQGIVHRDLKPANILLTAAGEPKVGDFGIAHLAEADMQLTRTGAVLGTPQYMSPEQVRGGGLKPAADVHALGAILYEMLVHRPPHVGQSVTELYGKIVNDDPVPPSAIVSTLPRDLETITLKALEKSPDRRYPTAGEFGDDLRRYLNREPIQARPAGTVDRVVRWGRRRRALVSGLAVAAAALLAGSVLLAVRWRADRVRARWTAELEQVRDEVGRLDRLQDNGVMDDDLVARRFAAARDRVTILLGEADLAPGRLLLGRIQELSGQDDLARDEWRRALEIDPDFAPARYELGHSLMVRIILDLVSKSATQRRTFRPEAEHLAREASQLLEQAVGPGSGLENELQRRLARAILLHARGDGPGVQALARDSIQEFSAERGIEEMHLLLGLASRVPAERFASFSTALALRPRYAAARLARGLDLAFARQWEKAQEDFSAAIRFDPRLALAYANRAGVQGELGDLVSVLRDCGLAVAIDPRCGAAYCNRAVALQRMGKFDEALADCGRALDIDAGDSLALSTRAGILAQQGEADAAFRDCDRAIETAPDFPNPYGIRAGLWNGRSKFAEAEADATRAVTIDATMVAAWFNRGFSRLMTGRPQEALADYNEGIRLDDRQPVAFLGRARVRQRLGDLDGARLDADHALAIAPADWPARRSVIQLLGELKAR